VGTIDVRRAGDRLHSDLGWLDSWHSFSFSNHYDPKNTHHGLLLVNNDDIVAAAPFGLHPHQDMEIVTWVLDGALEHRDSEGNHGVIRPGLAQRMSAGRGIRHSEQNASATEPVHLLQMWVIPDVTGSTPEYEEVDVSDRLTGDALFPLASGREDDAAITIHQRDATLWVGRLDPGVDVALPDAPFVHLFVARGSADVDGVGHPMRRAVGPHDERFDIAGRGSEQLAREHDRIARHDALLHETRQAAVGEDLATRLATRAVDDLVRLVRDALEVGAAIGARHLVLAVDGEVLAELVL
jgi:redox-sensitive bicupin YhaK (pirin superfamily)